MDENGGRRDVFVLDGSVALAWCFTDESNSFADAISSRFPNVQAVVPIIWRLEVLNALLVGERRKRCMEADTAHWLAYLDSLPILIDDASSSRVWSDVPQLARAHQLTAYDASYLELALRKSVPLATLDDKLKAAATAAGIQEYLP